MRSIWRIIFAFLISSCFADSTNATHQNDNTQINNRPPVSPQYNNRFGFSFNRLVYERTKADSLYFGLDIWADFFETTYDKGRNKCHYINSYYYRRYVCDKTYKAQSGVCLRSEARLGYNFFFNGRDHLTPLAAGGYFRTIGNSHSAFLDFTYGALGFLYSHEFNTVFGWGLQLKGLLGQLRNHYRISEIYISGQESVFYYDSFKYDYLSRQYITTPVYREQTIWGKKTRNKVDKLFSWGIDFSLPIIFRFAHYRHWDITLEPSICYIGSKNTKVVLYAGRGTLGYRF